MRKKTRKRVLPGKYELFISDSITVAAVQLPVAGRADQMFWQADGDWYEACVVRVEPASRLSAYAITVVDSFSYSNAMRIVECKRTSGCFMFGENEIPYYATRLQTLYNVHSICEEEAERIAAFVRSLNTKPRHR